MKQWRPKGYLEVSALGPQGTPRCAVRAHWRRSAFLSAACEWLHLDLISAILALTEWGRNKHKMRNQIESQRKYTDTWPEPSWNLKAALAVSVASIVATAASGQILVAQGSTGNGVVSEYSTSGALINHSLVSGLQSPCGLALDNGGNLYVANYYYVSSTLGKYSLSGQTINASLISGLPGPFGLAVDGNGNLFVGNRLVSGSIGAYTT